MSSVENVIQDAQGAQDEIQTEHDRQIYEMKLRNQRLEEENKQVMQEMLILQLRNVVCVCRTHEDCWHLICAIAFCIQIRFGVCGGATNHDKPYQFKLFLLCSAESNARTVPGRARRGEGPAAESGKIGSN